MRYSHMHLMVFFDSSVNVSSEKTGGFYSSVQVFMWEMIQWVPLNRYHKILTTEKGDSYFSRPGFLAPLLDLWSSCDVVSCALLSLMKWRNVGSEAGASLNSLSLILQGAAQPPWYWAEGRSVAHCSHVQTCWNRLSPLVLTAASLLVSCRRVRRSRWSLFCFTADVKYIQNLNLKTGRRFVSCNCCGWMVDQLTMASWFLCIPQTLWNLPCFFWLPLSLPQSYITKMTWLGFILTGLINANKQECMRNRLSKYARDMCI